jgi:hypothetical protein
MKTSAVMAATVVFAFGAAFAVGPTLPKESGKVELRKAGVKVVDAPGKTCRFPWYVADVDYNRIETKEFWASIICPEGTRAACVGRYGDIHWCEFHDGGSSMMMSTGLDFIDLGRHPVAPGHGKVHVRWWLHTEEAKGGDEPRFRMDRYYVFCLDREPQQTWTNLAKEPACDMDTELDHVIGIIEVRPTFDEVGHEPSEAMHLEPGTLKSFREERLNGLPKTYELEYGVERGGDGLLSFVNGTGRRVPADPATMKKLVYAMNTSGWTKAEKDHTYENAPAVTRTLIDWTDRNGKARKAAIGYDTGGWFMETDGRFYQAYYPNLLYEVKSEIEAKLKEGVEGK